MSKGYTTTEYLASVRRMIRAAGKRVAKADPAELAQLMALQAELDEAIKVAVVGLRRDHTWESIGKANGKTRQAAIMRWGYYAREAEAHGPTTQGTRRMAQATTTDEVW